MPKSQKEVLFFAQAVVCVVLGYFGLVLLYPTVSFLSSMLAVKLAFMFGLM